MLKLFWGQKKQKIRKMMNRFWKIFEFFDEIGKFGDAEILTNKDVEDDEMRRQGPNVENFFCRHLGFCYILLSFHKAEKQQMTSQMNT